MTSFRRVSALLLAALLLLNLPFALMEETAPGAETPQETTQVSEIPEEAVTPVEPPAETEETAEEAAAPAFSPLPLMKNADMPKPGIEVKAEAIVIRAEGTTLFELPAHESAILARLDGGTVLTLAILGQSWSRVKVQGQEGYVATKDLSFAFGSSLPNLAIVTAPGGKLTLREEMTTKSKALVSIPSGRAVLLLAKGEVFSLVRFEDKEGYVLTAHLEEVPAGQLLGQYTQVVSLTAEREANVRLRAQPKKNATVYTTVKSGNSVVVLGIENDWAQVEYEGFHGYMMAEYLKKFD